MYTSCNMGKMDRFSHFEDVQFDSFQLFLTVIPYFELLIFFTGVQSSYRENLNDLFTFAIMPIIFILKYNKKHRFLVYNDLNSHTSYAISIQKIIWWIGHCIRHNLIPFIKSSRLI